MWSNRPPQGLRSGPGWRVPECDMTPKRHGILSPSECHLVERGVGHAGCYLVEKPQSHRDHLKWEEINVCGDGQ